jgi:L-ascorbate metabolism protein UlaG (beta-lactamase superfamily)
VSLRISRILHAGYVFECQGIQIAFDPLFENPFSRNCHAYPDVKFDTDKIQKLRFAAVFISHFHDDHCSMESLRWLDRETPIFIFCQHEEMLAMIRELGFIKVQPLQLDQVVTVGGFEVTPRRALDADVDSIFHIKADGLNVLNVVDSWIDWETLDLLVQSGPWDMVLWPFQTMREIEVLAPSRAEPAPKDLPPEWMEQLRALNPRLIVPSSCQFLMEDWSWYNHAFFPVSYRQFQAQIEQSLPSCQVIRLNPSVSVTLSENAVESSALLDWVNPVGEQDVDYDYQPDVKPSSTADIARKFPPLTDAQFKRVLEYCQNEIIEQYKTMDPPQDPYFQTARNWRLTIYDHAGKAIDFYYHLEPDKITRLSAEEKPLAWTTEVPAFKLHAALEEGEALTSMYVRVNDHRFESEIEKDIGLADILEDPLIRCLFTGSFGAYQKAQLRRIRGRV